MVNLKVSTQASELWGCRVLTYTQENPRGELCCEWTFCIKCHLYRAGAGLHWSIGCANSASSTAVHPFNGVFIVYLPHEQFTPALGPGAPAAYVGKSLPLV